MSEKHSSPEAAKTIGSVADSKRLTVISCSKDDSYCIIDWTLSRLSIQTGKIRYNFPFNRCSMTSIWIERSLLNPGRLVRRAVICVHGFTVWNFTLNPEIPSSQELGILRLADALGFKATASPSTCRALLHRDVIRRSNIGRTATFLQSLFRTEPLPSARVESAAVYDTAVTSAAVGQVSLTPIQPAPRALFSICLAGCYRALTSPADHFTQATTKASDIFGSLVDWKHEPVFPVVLFTFRHGQQQIDPNLESDPPLTELGRLQSIRVAELIFRMTNGYKDVHGIWSSRCFRSTDSADIVQMIAARYSTDQRSIERVYHNLLSEFTFPYPFLIELEGKHREQVEKELEEDAKALSQSRGIFSSALRGQGALSRNAGLPFNPADLCGDGRFAESGSSSFFLTHRFPSIQSTQWKIAGFYLTTPPALKSPADCHPVSYVYSGHGNTIRHQVFEELGFPPHFWRHAQLPHAAVLVTGLHSSGRPGLIVADAGYVVSPPNSVGLNPVLPLTFTPLIEGEIVPTKGLSCRDKLATDHTVCLLREEEWFGREASPGVRYNAPSEVPDMEKHILMVRTGHNRVTHSRDSGLTEIGFGQIAEAANWLGHFLKNSPIIRRPRKWCTAGLSSQWASVDVSLKESIVAFRRGLSTHIGKETYCSSLLESDDELFPEALFGAAKENDVLYAVLADDYHLLRYFGACFGISPASLQYFFWPHAAYMLITVSDIGWPELRIFGTVSHLHPSHVSYAPPTSADVRSHRENLFTPSDFSSSFHHQISSPNKLTPPDLNAPVETLAPPGGKRENFCKTEIPRLSDPAGNQKVSVVVAEMDAPNCDSQTCNNSGTDWQRASISSS